MRTTSPRQEAESVFGLPVARTTDGGPGKRGRGIFEASKNSMGSKIPRPLFPSAATLAHIPKPANLCVRTHPPVLSRLTETHSTAP